MAAWEGVRDSVMELEEDGRWRDQEEGDTRSIKFKMKRELLGGRVQEEVRAKEDEGKRELMDDGPHVECVLEGVQDQHGGRGNQMREGQDPKRGLKRGNEGGGRMSPDDQSDQSGSGPHGQVQRGEALLGGGGGSHLQLQKRKTKFCQEKFRHRFM